MKILFATNNVGGSQVAEPIARVAKARGHTPIIMAEGLSVQEWKNRGWELAFEGTRDFEKEPFEFDPRPAIEAARADVVVVTYGAPPNIEKSLALAAAGLGLPLVGVEDSWGVSRRITPEVFDLILTEEFGARVIAELSPDIRAKVVEVGSAFVADMRQNPVPWEIHRVFNDRCGWYNTLLVAGNDHDTQYFLHWALVAAGRTMIERERPTKVIVRYHPRTRATEKDRECWMLQVKLFAGLFGESAVTMIPEIADTRLIARMADATVSNYGTLFKAAAVSRKIPIRISSPVCDSDLLSESGLPYHPMVRVSDQIIGAALEFDWEQAVDLDKDVFAKKEEVNAAQRANFKPSTTVAEDAMDEIEKLVNSRK